MGWIFQVRRDGHIVNEVVLKGKPRTYGYVRLYISDKFYGPGLAVIKNLVYRNTDYTGRAFNQSTAETFYHSDENVADSSEMKYGEDEIEYEEEMSNEEDEISNEEDEMNNEEDEMNNEEDEMNNEEDERKDDQYNSDTEYVDEEM